MQPCHTKPFVRPGIVLEAPTAVTQPLDLVPVAAECCDYCGSHGLEWRKCKLICADCRQINKSCADL